MSDLNTITVPCPPFTVEERKHLRERLCGDVDTYATVAYSAVEVRFAFTLLEKLSDGASPLLAITPYERSLLLSVVDVDRFPDREGVTPELMEKLRLLKQTSHSPCEVTAVEDSRFIYGEENLQALMEKKTCE